MKFSERMPADRSSFDDRSLESDSDLFSVLHIYGEDIKPRAVSPADLGFREPPSVSDFLRRAKEKGLKVCPPGVSQALFVRMAEGGASPDDQSLFVVEGDFSDMSDASTDAFYDLPSSSAGPYDDPDGTASVSVPVREIGPGASDFEGGVGIRKTWASGSVDLGSRWVFSLQK